MPLKVLHTSDIHLGMKFASYEGEAQGKLVEARFECLSRLVAEILSERMRSGHRYEAAREAFFAVRPRQLSQPGRPRPSRDELHDRSGLR